ncbi:hypothetical protein HSX11_00660 [Oxalobacteraceae bacterium]|nr:hypothetical protein [Oxalobacteraceae bacterium]
MSLTELPFRATTEQACAWLEQQTGAPWTLARLIENELLPYVWLDYDANYPELFGDANGGYAAPIFFHGDTQRLLDGASDVLITITKDVYRIVTTLPAPGFTRQLHELRFTKKDLERLAAKLKREAEPEPVKVEAVEAAKESQAGICREQVLIAFAGMGKIDLEKSLTDAIGIFGDDGARVKASVKKSKKNAVWNPVTLALGLNEVYRVPVSRLKKAFQAHEFLHEWADQWEQSLALLGK